MLSKGDQGAVGRPGEKGSQGDKGEKGQAVGISGVKYVRWGRTTCPSGAQVVYKGIHNEKMVTLISLKSYIFSRYKVCFYYTILGGNCTKYRINLENCSIFLSGA